MHLSPARYWNSLPPLKLCVALSRAGSVDWHASFYIAALSKYSLSRISLVAILCWLNLSFNINILLPLFCSTWSMAWGWVGPGPGYLCGPGGWAVIIELVYPLSNIALKGLAFVFPRTVDSMSKIRKKQWPTLRVFRPPSRRLRLSLRVKWCEEKIFRLQSLHNAKIWNDHAVMNADVSDLNIHFEQSETEDLAR